jgi:putative restriction endonuclease
MKIKNICLLLKINDVMKNKKQIYEKYWSITLAYTDINSIKFRSTLKAIVDFIDNYNITDFNSQTYINLQNYISVVNNLKGVSLRKSINQFVKLGFINYKLRSYHKDTKAFLNAQTFKKRKTLFSKIVYENSSFDRDVTKDSNKREINFLLKTLEEIGCLSKEEIMAIMRIDVTKYKKGYLNKEELNFALKDATKINFLARKYNQISYLITILKKLDDLIFISNKLYFKEDACNLFGSDFEYRSLKKRDVYLHRLYKNQLVEESELKDGKINCMLEHLDYPSLVASHIKPFLISKKDEAYDPENGLLLSRNMDLLFDQGYISFNENGKIMLSNKLSSKLKINLSKYLLDVRYITEKRKIYLKYHQQNVFKK